MTFSRYCLDTQDPTHDQESLARYPGFSRITVCKEYATAREFSASLKRSEFRGQKSFESG